MAVGQQGKPGRASPKVDQGLTVALPQEAAAKTYRRMKWLRPQVPTRGSTGADLGLRAARSVAGVGSGNDELAAGLVPA
jgi:hypothetical protein